MKVTDRRKILAVLAGGLVLGVGAAVTLAAWNDSEFAQGTFTAGSFNLEGSVDNTDWGDHNADEGDSAASLVFSTPFENMSPDDTVYAPFWVRLAAGTTTDATLASDGITDVLGDAADALAWKVFVDPATCDEAGVSGETALDSGAALVVESPLTPVGSVNLTAGADASTPGTAVQLCFAVTASATEGTGAGELTQGDSATATWKFTATSTS